MKNLFAIIALMFAVASHATGLVYYDARQLPLYGTVVEDDTNPWKRLPEEMKDSLRPDLFDLGSNTAGLYLRFSSNTTALSVKWKSLKKFNMNHMTPTGIRGLDMYVMQPDSSWTFLNSVRPLQNNHNTTYSVVDGLTADDREYMLYLPLYDGIDSLYIGIDSAAVIGKNKIDLPCREKPIVMYGTSILQGGCATRAGMAHTNILGRMMNREIINLGFSGNAKLDVEIAQLMASVENAGLYVIDCMPNNTTGRFKNNIDAFYNALRSSRPDVPILFIESPYFPISRFKADVMAALKEKNEALRAFYESRVAAGDKYLYYMKGEDVLGKEVEGTVDNYHFTDAAFQRFAEKLLPLLQEYSVH